MNEWTRRTTLILVIYIVVAAVAFPIIYAQGPEPNTSRSGRAEQFLADTARTPPPKDPNVPHLVRQTLVGQILPAAEDWLKYFDTTPRDTVQVYYNLNVFLNVLRLQEAQIKQLTERVENLESQVTNLKKQLVTAGIDFTFVDPNVPLVVK